MVVFFGVKKMSSKTWQRKTRHRLKTAELVFHLLILLKADDGVLTLFTVTKHQHQLNNMRTF